MTTVTLSEVPMRYASSHMRSATACEHIPLGFYRAGKLWQSGGGRGRKNVRRGETRQDLHPPVKKK